MNIYIYIQLEDELMGKERLAAEEADIVEMENKGFIQVISHS